MTVVLYKSTDASAPVLTGEVGSLVSLLDACLVNGYGSKAAAGWTKPYTDTNKAVFRNSTSTGTGFYLDVNDAAPATAKEARVRGYEVMTAVATGTEPFPTVSQKANGLFIRKSNTANSTARVWTLIADETVFYLFTGAYDYPGSYIIESSWFTFGDFYSFKAGDAYACQIVGRIVENTDAYNNVEGMPLLANNYYNALSSTCLGHYLARDVTAIAGSVPFGIHAGDGISSVSVTSVWFGNNTIGITAFPTYPNPADNGLYMSPAYIHHGGGNRGYHKGLWAPSQYMPLAHGVTFSGTGTLASKQFMAIRGSYSGSSPAECFIEISDTWS